MNDIERFIEKKMDAIDVLQDKINLKLEILKKYAPDKVTEWYDNEYDLNMEAMHLWNDALKMKEQILVQKHLDRNRKKSLSTF